MSKPQKATQLMAVKVGEDSYVAVLTYDQKGKTSSEVQLRIVDVYALAEKNGLPSRPTMQTIKGSTDILLFASPSRAGRIETEAEVYRSHLNRIASSTTS